MKPIDPSKYRRPIYLHKRIDTVDSGAAKGTSIWQDVYTSQTITDTYKGTVTMAQVTPVGGMELLRAGRLEGRGMYKIALRYNPTIPFDAEVRIYDNGKYYNIRSVSDTEELHREWAILAEETTQPE